MDELRTAYLEMVKVQMFLLWGMSQTGFVHVLVGGEERFRVDKDTGIIMTTGLPLTWNKEYVVTVEASDKYGNKSPYASISILAGSRPPQFTNMSYSVFVPENTPAGEK